MRFKDFASQSFARDTLDRLTEEEEQVLFLRGNGQSIVQVSISMGLSPESVHRRQRSVLKKIG